MTIEESRKLSPTVMFSLIVAVGTILAAGILTMWAIIVEPPGDTIGKSFITIFIAAAFAFTLIAETRSQRKENYVTMGRIGIVFLIAISGLYLTWNQISSYPWDDLWDGDFAAWLGVIFMLEGVAATAILFWPAIVSKMKIAMVKHIFNIGMALLLTVTILISLAWTMYDFDWPGIYWRWVLALSVLALVMFTIPLVVTMILAPKKPKRVYQQPVQQPYQQYPTHQQVHGSAGVPSAGVPQDQIWGQVVEESRQQQSPPTQG